MNGVVFVPTEQEVEKNGVVVRVEFHPPKMHREETGFV